MSDVSTGPDRPVSGWARGAATFAGVILALIGVFQLINGLQAIIHDDFFVVGEHYTFDLDTTVWGWIHLVIGIVMLLTAFGLFTRAGWAAVAGIIFAGLSAIANFFFIPYYPVWSIVIIALDVWVIWALTRPGVMRD
ncbi:DUF7144 family membrane protein [Capillimicrobium parvum]|uniref:DUF7144 domain-containing protein n=1 Tax=Capillimicrobium parvum TaxID=2884022 RepID=A0A9E7C387_9ACTN|nr:hypothetical protein [Capillimicrobium parvum]UGS38397.1 hypothetical protein DSM104329_04823 [Capillimicrobium parvum]